MQQSSVVPTPTIRSFDRGSTGPDPSTPSGTVLLCFSHLRWGFVWQRPQHLLTRAARQATVLYVEEPVFRPGVEPHVETFVQPSGVRVILPVLPDGLGSLAVDGVQQELVKELLAEHQPERLILWYYTPMAMAFSADIPADVVVYDNMDELSAFRGASPEMLANEADLFARADLVFTGGRSLYEAKRARHPSVHFFPSSIEFAHFAKARDGSLAEPADLADIPHPRLGFVGVIDERMDLSIVAGMAKSRPGWQFVMVGPVVKIDPATIPQAANIHWLGSREYNDLPAYMAGWDVALMPFAINEATRFISPTKTPEYLSAGLPVVSSPVADVVTPYGDLGFVQLANTPAAFVAAAERLLDGRTERRLSEVDAFLARGSWEATWAAMQGLMDAGTRGRANRTGGAQQSTLASGGLAAIAAE